MPNAWLQLKKDKPQLKKALRQQLAKDLRLSVEQIPEKDLLVWLSHWLQEHTHQLAEVLYRIDLSEKKVQAQPQRGFEQLALQILEREAQKVIFRAQYSGKL